LQFAQSPWLREYIELNTKFRILAKNDFEKNLYKFMKDLYRPYERREQWCIMTEFVGLRAKMYAWRVEKKKNTKKAKGEQTLK